MSLYGSLRRTGTESKLSLTSSSFRGANPQSDNKEKDEAILLINDYRLSQGKSKKTKGFSYGEVNAVLSDLIQTRSYLPPGLVLALLSEDHDVNFSIRPKENGLLGKFGRKELEVRRSNMIEQATLRCSLDVFQLLIKEADEEALDAALWISINQNLAEKADICFQNRASLPQDPTFDGKEFVCGLVQQQQRQLLNTVLRHCGISSTTFTAAIQTSMDLENIDAISEFAEILVSAGPGQQAISEALISTVQRAAHANSEFQYLNLVCVLLEEGNANVNYDSAKCMKVATEAGHSEILDRLLEHSPSIQSLNDTLAFAMSLSAVASRDYIIQSLKKARNQISENPEHPSIETHRSLPMNRLQVLKTTKRLPQPLEDGILLKAAATGEPSSCQELLDFLKEWKSKLKVSNLTDILGEILLYSAQSGIWLPAKTLEVISYLLTRGAKSREVDAGFCKTLSHTMLTPNIDAANLLAHSTSKETFGIALNTLELKVQSEDDVWRVHSIVERGASKESVHLAFCLAMMIHAQKRSILTDNFIQTLFISDLDVDGQDGECLQVAADSGNSDILEKLLIKANARSKSVAFSAALFASHPENLLVTLLDILKRHNFNPRLAQEIPKGNFPYLFVCLQLYPNSPKLVQRLISEGCSIHDKIFYCCYEDLEIDEEMVTVLIWALCQVGKCIPSETILMLLKHCDINFQTSNSMVTPLILAAKAQREDILLALISKKARPSLKDKNAQSALFYASRQGNIKSVNALLEAKAPINDGSLHEAARELHADIIAALIKAKHDTSFTSIHKDHNGRTPLQEMLLKCDGRKYGISRIEESIRALTKDNPLTEDDFFLALNNPNPIPLIGALRTCGLYTSISSGMIKKQVIDTEFEYYYSPTMYIRLGFTYGPHAQRDGLINELRKFGVQDQFYARAGLRQPGNSIGTPAIVLEWEAQRLTQRQQYRNELHSHLQQHRQQQQMQNKKLKKKDLEVLQRNEQQAMKHLEAQFAQEDQVYASRDADIQKNLRTEANALRVSIESQAQDAAKLARDCSIELRKRQEAKNLEIQQGNAAERRDIHMQKLMEKRHGLFLAGIEGFSERAKEIAGWNKESV